MTTGESTPDNVRLAIVERRLDDMTARLNDLDELLRRDTLADRVTRVEISLKEFRQTYESTTAHMSAKLDTFSQTNTAIKLMQPVITSLVTAVAVSVAIYVLGLPTP